MTEFFNKFVPADDVEMYATFGEEDDYRRKDVLHWIRVRAMYRDMPHTIASMLQDDNSLDNEDDKKYHMSYHQVADCFFIGLTNNTGDPAEFWRPFREELLQRLGVVSN